MPIETFWELRELLDDSIYRTSAGEDRSDIVEIYKKIFRISAPHAVVEKDRYWLYARAKS